MLQIETIARILIDLELPFNYRVEGFKKEIELIKNGRLSPFLAVQYNDNRGLTITNIKGDRVEPTDLLHSFTQLLKAS